MEDKKSQELLQKIKNLVEEEGMYLEDAEKDMHKLIREYVIPALRSSKDVQKDLYADFTANGGGLVKKAKNFILRKIGNVTRNVVERSFVRQQKFNNNIIHLLDFLVAENAELKSKLADIEAKK